MTDGRKYGAADGIEKRLVYWRRQLSLDKRYPWVGSGLLEDLVCAAKMLGGDVSEFERPADNLEFDL
jgi:hypothetical protein